MKIKIITNTFGSYHRQNIAVDSWRYLRERYKGIVEIINCQFKDEEDTFVNPYPDIPVKFWFSRSSKNNIPNAEKKLPFVSDLFSAGLDEECDGFIWTNSDVIITNVLIDKIINQNPKAIACSRLDIQDIDSFQKVLDRNVVPVRWEIAGVDTCYFRKDWATEYQNWFTNNDYLLGKFLFDCQWGAMIKILGDPTQPVENGYPVSCFHIHHGISAVTQECPERTWNLNIAESNPMNKMFINTWTFYFTQNLMRRTPFGAFLEPKPEERHIEDMFFKYMSLNRDLR